MNETIVGGKYRLGRKLGGGSFGEIFLGMDFWLMHVQSKGTPFLSKIHALQAQTYKLERK